MSLEKFYKNPKEPASSGGINALHRAVEKPVKTKDIKQWLEIKDLHTLHKPFCHTTNQSGSGIPHYEGISFQTRYGLEGVFRRLFREALPFLVRGGKVVGKEA
ncbi:hypothetical protein CEXT_547041 [Caerostris extrusa]|uniref:Uncharacterized protein n=1 Tax=Caerostris extrusa TaxID=172846 RepID=A0AAV4PKC1_CAEEX|nr:hypothetical protein CEXT_547041 [Caerostris extrusa]